MAKSTASNLVRLGVLMLVAALIFVGQLFATAQAAPLDPGKLRNGADVLSTLRGRDSKVDAFIDKVTSRLPPEARSDGSNLTGVSADTTDSDIQNPDNIFLTDKDGNVRYIPKDQLRGAMEEFTQFVTEQPDFDQLWDEAKTLVPEKHQGKIATLEAGLDLARFLGLPLDIAEVLRDKGPSLLEEAIGNKSDDNRVKAEAQRDQMRNGQPVAGGPPPGGTPPGGASGGGTPPGGGAPSGGTSTAGGPGATGGGTPGSGGPGAGTGGAGTASGPSPACQTAKAELAAARNTMAGGDLGGAESQLSGVDISACPSLAGDVNAAKSDITSTVARLNAASSAANASCEPGEIGKAASDLDGYSHPGLSPTAASLNGRASGLRAARANFETARSTYQAGNLDAARGQLEGVISSMGVNGLQTCAPYDRANDGIGKIDRLTTLVAQANAAAASCDERAITRMAAGMGRIDHVVARAAVQQLEAAKARCVRDQDEEQQTAEADQRCIDRYGPRSYSQSSTGDGINTCGCRAPYTMNFEGARCVRPEEVMAEGDNSCRSEFGPSAYADYKGSSYKTYVCNCARGSKWNEGRTRCVTREEVIAGIRDQARQECLRQRKGRRLTRVEVDPSSGKYTCHFTTRTRTTRKPPVRRPPTRRPPTRTGTRHDPVASQVLGAAIGTAIGIGTRRGGGRRGGRPSGGKGCHHRRSTSRQHCGGG